MFQLRRYLKKYKPQLIIGPFFKLLEAIFELIIPMVMAAIIDVGIKNSDKDYVLNMSMVMLLLAVCGLVSALICQYSASVASQGFGTNLRRELFAHINKLSHKELDVLGTPSLITRLTSDINQVQIAVAMTIRLVSRVPFIIIGAMVMAAIINGTLSFIFIGAAVVIGIVLYVIMTKSVPYFKRIQKKLDTLSLISRENLSGSRVIRALAKQNTEQKRFGKGTRELADESIKIGRVSALLNPVTYVVTNLAIVLIIWFGAGQVNSGNMLTGDIVALVNYMTQILLAMIVLAQLIVYFTKAQASAQRIQAVFDTKPSVTQQAPDKVIQSNVFRKAETGSDIKIQFQNVSFAYGDGDMELENISFTIKKGETVGIIGGTGSGKTTLIQLIPRFYDAAKGTVYVDGKNVKEYTFETLRGQMGIVPQNAVLFSGTVRENMQWGSPHASDKEIMRAIEIAQAKEFVDKLKRGLDSPITQGGKNLSGGQRQRLTIARALVSMPKLLILDDSFSALDYVTDVNLRKALKQQINNMTVIIVSQRCSTIKNADNILFLDDGRLLGQGTHEQLYNTCDEYRQICLSQLSAEEVSGL